MLDQKLLSKSQVLRMYNFKPGTLSWLIRTRQIPGLVRVGRGKGVFYFDPQELDQWIEQNKISTEKG
jgi:hypothetical protein